MCCCCFSSVCFLFHFYFPYNSIVSVYNCVWYTNNYCKKKIIIMINFTTCLYYRVLYIYEGKSIIIIILILDLSVSLRVCDQEKNNTRIASIDPGPLSYACPDTEECPSPCCVDKRGPGPRLNTRTAPDHNIHIHMHT